MKLSLKPVWRFLGEIRDGTLALLRWLRSAALIGLKFLFTHTLQLLYCKAIKPFYLTTKKNWRKVAIGVVILACVGLGLVLMIQPEKPEPPAWVKNFYGPWVFVPQGTEKAVVSTPKVVTAEEYPWFKLILWLGMPLLFLFLNKKRSKFARVKGVMEKLGKWHVLIPLGLLAWLGFGIRWLWSYSPELFVQVTIFLIITLVLLKVVIKAGKTLISVLRTKGKDRKISPQWYAFKAFSVLFLVPIILAYLYLVYRRGDSGASFFQNLVKLGFPDMALVIGNELGAVLAIALIWWLWLWLKKQQGYWKWIWVLILVLVGWGAFKINKIPRPGSAGTKEVSESFELVEVKDFKLSKSAVKVFQNLVPISREGDLSHQIQIVVGETYAIRTSGGIKYKNLGFHIKRRKGVDVGSGYRVSWDAKVHIFPNEIPLHSKDIPCYITAPYCAPIVSIKHDTGVVFAYAPAMKPGQEFVIVRALRSGTLHAKYNVLTETGVSGALGINLFSVFYKKKSQGGVMETNLIMEVWRLPQELVLNKG